MSTVSDKQIATQLRWRQEEDETFGPLFKALHTFADRTVEFFFSDTPDIPHPVLAFDKVRSSCRGEYRPVDGLLLEHRITIDPYKVSNGAEAAEVLAHELVHMWQHHLGKMPERNYHNAEFHNRIGLMGIMTSGKRGHHEGYIEGDVWQEWLDQNDDLCLPQFYLPGEQDTRQLLKWICYSCGFSFRSRREDVKAVCMMEDCETEFELADD